MSQGVEWALHSCVNLAWSESGPAVTAASLARFHELPGAYLNKQLQALARAGIVTSVPGPRGGYRLSRAPSRITLLEVVSAIEGPDPAFRCAEIRQRGPLAGRPSAYRTPCAIAGAMARAERVWRHELESQTVADLMANAEQSAPGLGERVRHWFAQA
jgi:Rrf2 family protein